MSQSHPGTEILCLYKNHTFCDTIFFDVGGSYVFRGTWYLSKGNVVLKEKLKQVKVKTRVNDTLVEKRASVSSKVLRVYNYEDSTKLIGADIAINGSKTVLNINSDGVCILPNIPIQLIAVRFFSFANVQFKIKDPSKNDFTAYVNIKSQPWLKTLPITRWVIKGQNLIGLKRDGHLDKSTILIKK